MANLKWDKLMLFIFVCLPVTLLIWCLKYCCRQDETEDSTNRSAATHPMLPPPCSYPQNQNRSASYSPYSRRSPRLGFGTDIDDTTSSRACVVPYPHNSFSNAASTSPYPVRDAMPQSSITRFNATAPYPAPNTPSADQPPSYAEVMQNKCNYCNNILRHNVHF